MDTLVERAAEFGLAPWRSELATLIAARKRYLQEVDRKSRRYLDLLPALPDLQPSHLDLDAPRLVIGRKVDAGPEERQVLHDILQALCPWRKGPFRLFGIDIDSEWRSDLKWNRLKAAITPLADRRILDIGSSNGYYLFRMSEAGPKLALGVEPYLTNYYQFRILQHYARQPDLFNLPVRFEDLPDLAAFFDTVFSLGILYHRRSPLDALAEKRRVLRRGGELVLETLVIPGSEPICLCPQRRYAKMNNTFFLPTVRCLEQWLARSGFEHVRCIDVTATTSSEQRATPWVGTESLADFLDPDDAQRTIEGHPAPLRALLLANAR